jgi:hypothetical protein
MTQRTVVMLTALLCAAHGNPAIAQDHSRSVNPQAIEFDLQSLNIGHANQTNIRVDFFEAGANLRRDVPIKSTVIPTSDMNDRTVRVDVMSLLGDLPDGEYVAAIRSESPDQSLQGEVSAVFVLNHGGVLDDRLPRDPRDRFWTKVGLAIGAGLLLTPLLIR